jgi:hypothetical protein
MEAYKEKNAKKGFPEEGDASTQKVLQKTPCS